MLTKATCHTCSSYAVKAEFLVMSYNTSINHGRERAWNGCHAGGISSPGVGGGCPELEGEGDVMLTRGHRAPAPQTGPDG